MNIFSLKYESSPAVVQLGEGLLGGDWYLKPFLMTQHAFVFMQGGDAVFYLDGEKINIGQGQSLFIKKGTILSSQPPPHASFRCSWIHFTTPEPLPLTGSPFSSCLKPKRWTSIFRQSSSLANLPMTSVQSCA